MTELGGLIIKGVSSWFNTKQEINKVKVEAEKKVIVAKAEADSQRLLRESSQDYDLNTMAVQNMSGSWKDEFILIFICIPLIMLFIPEYQVTAAAGFTAFGEAPIVYQVLVVSIFLSIYGLRDVLKTVLSIMLGRANKG